MDKWKALLGSRRFWVAFAGLIAVLGQDVFGYEVNAETVVAIGLIVGGWIVGNSTRPEKPKEIDHAT